MCGSALFGALEPRGLALELAQVEQARTLDLALLVTSILSIRGE